jgi:CHAT domain-containing protein/Flp pilus assembly protein TadD
MSLFLTFLVAALTFFSFPTQSEKSDKQKLSADTVKAAELVRQANHFSGAGRFDSAIVCFSAAAGIYQHYGLEKEYAMAIIKISEQYVMGGVPSEGLKYGKEAMALATKLQEENLIGRCLSNFGSVAFNMGNIDSAQYYFNCALAIAQKEPGIKSLFLSDCYGNLGVILQQKHDFSKALVYLNKAIETYPYIKGKEDDNIYFYYYYLGMIHQQLANYSAALDYYKLVIDGYYRKYGDGHPLMAGIYNNLGEISKMMGKLEDARIYNQRARMILEATRGKNDILWVNATNNLAGIYNQARQYREALSLLLQVKNFYEKQPNAYYDLGMSLNSIGHVYDNLNIHDSAEYYFLQGIKLAENFETPPDLLCNLYSNLGVMYAFTGRMTAGARVTAEAIRKFQSSGAVNHTVFARLYFNLGTMFSYMDLYDDAIKNFQKSMTYNVKTYKDTNRFSNPVLTNVSDKHLLMKTLSSKADAMRLFHYTHADTQVYLKGAFESAYLAVLAIDSLRTESSTGLSNMLGNEGLPYSTGIELAFVLNKLSGDYSYLEKAFEISEKSKYNTLYQSLIELNAKNIGGIPDSLQNLERIFRTELASIFKALDAEQQKPNQDPVRIKMLEKKQFALKMQSDSLMKSFEREYPSYYRLKYDRKMATIGEVRQSLEPDHAVVEYAIGLDRIVVFVITPTSVTMTSRVGKDLYDKIDILRSIISQHDISEAGIASYTQAAGVMYEMLLAPVEPLIRGKHLIIIPDGKLGAVPFEALVNVKDKNEKYSFSSLPYLTREYAIGYSYSSTLYLNSLSMNEQRASNREIAAFAPTFGNNKNLLAELKERGTDFSDLEGARQEVVQLGKLYGGRIFLDTSATLQNFLRFSPDYSLLHVSTHGIIDDTKPLESRLVFYRKNDSTPADLYLHDLYNMKLNASLVVLSACNTGYGKLTSGEGIISLSSAFMYTGVPSLVSTLWSVNDRSTAEVMDEFYRQLFEKQEKPVALQQARLTYLSKADNLVAHPYYWAGFISIGDDRPLVFPNTLTLVAVVGAVLAITLVLIYLFRRKKTGIS